MDWKRYAGLTSLHTIKRPMEAIQREKQEAVSAVMRGERVPDPGVEWNVELVKPNPGALANCKKLVDDMTVKALRSVAVPLGTMRFDRITSQFHRSLDDGKWVYYDGEETMIQKIRRRQNEAKSFFVPTRYKPGGAPPVVKRISNAWLNRFPGPMLGEMVRCFDLQGEEESYVARVIGADTDGYFVVTHHKFGRVTHRPQNWLTEVFPADIDVQPEPKMTVAVLHEGKVLRPGVVRNIEGCHVYSDMLGGVFFFHLSAWMRTAWPVELRYAK